MLATIDEAMHIAADEVPGCLVSDNRSHPLTSDPSIYASDLIHCNARGHAVAATTLVHDLHNVVAHGGQPSAGATWS